MDYACAGHPPAALIDGGGQSVHLLQTKGIAIGLQPGATFTHATVTVPERGRLYVFSDGAFEIERPDGSMMQLDDLVGLISRPAGGGECNLDRLLQHLVQTHGGEALDDDFSIVRCAF